MGEPAVVADNLTKHFGPVAAVAGLSFEVERGRVVGLLGPNGAGKTTTVRMLLGLIRPATGSAYILGQRMRPSHPVLHRVGALVEKPAFVPYLTGIENLRMHWHAGGEKWPPPSLNDALEVANLGDAVNRKVRGYSQGMRQRLGLAQSLLNRPDLLVLDEPTNGMDPAETRRIRETVRDLAEHGTTILLSSHILAEVEQVCSDVLVVDHGRLVAGGTVAELTAAAKAIELEVGDVAAAVTLLRGMPGVLKVEPRRGGLVVDLDGIRRSEIVAALVGAGIAVEAVVPRRHLEDAYLSLVDEDAPP